jgi:hypothetical protein
MEQKTIDIIFNIFIEKTKVYREKLNHIDRGMFMCDVETLKKQIQEAENLDDGMSHLCEVHGYVFPCPVCDEESDS